MSITSELYLPNTNTGNQEKHHIQTEINSIEDMTAFMKLLNQKGTNADHVRAILGQTLLVGALPVGIILPYSANAQTPPPGFLYCEGQAVSRTMYPDLFDLIGTTYGAGDGETTFNLPNLTLGEFLEGSSTAGTSKNAGLPNITGATGTVFRSGSLDTGTAGTGALRTNYNSEGNFASGGMRCSWKNIVFNASFYNSIYGNSTTVQPKSLTVRYIIKAFDTSTTNSSLIDITQYANELDQRYDLRSDMTIIYPNNGTAANPANVTIGTSYIMQNPFPGYIVHCSAEVFCNNQWGVPGFAQAYDRSGYGWISYGVTANQHNNDYIDITVGNTYASITGSAHKYNLSGVSFPTSVEVALTSVPCRVKVWKIGKVANS